MTILAPYLARGRAFFRYWTIRLALTKEGLW